MKNWYAATCKLRFSEQDRAEQNLRSQRLEVFNPRVRVQSIVKTVTEFAFPGYIFIQFDSEIQSASSINSTRGVKQLVSFGKEPARIHDATIEALKQRFDGGEQLIANIPEPGDEVEITSGSMAGIKAIFKESNGEKRSILLIGLLGSQQRIDIDNRQFARAEACQKTRS